MVSTTTEQQLYREASDVVPENKGLKRWILNTKYKEVGEINLPDSPNWEKVDSVGLAKISDKTNNVLVFTGYYNAETDGVYDFELKSDGGSLFYIGDELIVDKRDKNGPFKKVGIVALKKGWHSFSVRYLSSNTPREISVRVTKPNGSSELLNNITCSFN